jgi:hypothetical protein
MTRAEWRWRPALLTPAFVVVVLSPRVSPSQVAVTGRVVVGETGASLEGATVILEPGPGAEGERRTAQTDAKGRFQWDDVPAGQYVVRIQAEAYLERTREVTISEEDVHLALSVLTTPDLTGRVLKPDGEPVANAHVSCSTMGQTGRIFFQRPAPDAETDETGKGRVGGVTPGPCYVTVFAPGCKPFMRRDVVVEAGEETAIEVKLEPE